MKRNWLYGLCILFFLTACNGIKTVNSDMEDMLLGCENEMSTLILWIDKAKGEKVTDWGHFKNVKVRANVYADGTFRILSWCKKQEPDVIAYIEKRVAAFKITQFFFDEGYIEPGEQYLQLKYVPEKVNRK